MAVAFTRLRIAGFKSFAEPQTVEILPGLTGVVGPNGCGKSNVVEALRWAMGESSARSLRGGEMDDVIFAGTAARPSRNLAEVVLTLEDAVGAAPPPFHEQPELQVSRKIERGVGSAFRVNGREVRARDVQTLFADLASGARSAAMVSQGRVTTIINARPDERRAVLEEAAGITGLHARRHEAELKLRAAEANGGRADDLRVQLEAQHAGLQRQAKQANRFRTLSTAVREAEAELLAIGRARAERDRLAATASLTKANDAVVAAASANSKAAVEAGAAQASLPALREAEAAGRTALERQRVLQEQEAAEAARTRAALAAASARQGQIARDLQHAERIASDSVTATARLAEEEARLHAAGTDAPARLTGAEAAATDAVDAVARAEAAANRATEQAASLSATSEAIGQAVAAADARARRLGQQLAQVRADCTRAAAQAVDPARVAEAAAAAQAAEAAAAAARQALDEAERARAAGQAATAAARERAATAAAAHAKLQAEAQALAEVLAVKDGERWPPMVDTLVVPGGLEAALGAVLGEELSAAADPAAPRHWRDLPALPDAVLPGTPLSTLVQGPTALGRVLSCVSLVEAGDGDAAQPGLSPGQVLVSRDGAVWRWDGYTVRAGTPTAATVRLRQRNRLAALRTSAATARAASEDAATRRTAADAADRAATAAEASARSARREAEAAQERTRVASQRLKADADAASTRLLGLQSQCDRLQPEADDADATLARLQAEQAALPDLTMLRHALDVARAALSAARKAEAATRTAAADLRREAAAREARLRTIVAEAEDWRRRAADAAGRVTDLRARAAEAAAELSRLQDRPAAARNETAAAALAQAEANHARAAAALETALRVDTAASRTARAAETALAETREAAVRAEGAVAQADHAWGTVAERILEKLGAHPVLPAPPADISPDAEERARRRLDRLAREREEMGPVNLRAELEAAEVDARLASLAADRAELDTAIAKLRGSIGHINREGRERLAAVFAEVDRHFQLLFTRMFGGGKAQLASVGSDDPLQAGLEIYAQPPGKKLAALSLLSGGEQALTALSLIFAVFRCNPAPVCVLDEVDAPLDDANVGRFCTLLDEMVRETGTRFLVVTHHHMTMARMDRLYGVTMQERGVSRLLSVDLARASAMVDRREAAE